jgi:predicted HicB family RNase H-like nuclease
VLAQRSTLFVRLPAPLKRRLADEVARTGRSLNDIAVGMLAASVAVHFEPSGRAGLKPGGGNEVLLRMPAELKQKLALRAKERRRTRNELIVETLSERLGLGREERMASTNGHKPRSEDRVRVAIIGVGNCANSLVQGIEFYKDADRED